MQDVKSHISRLLHPFSQDLGIDFSMYLNHACRVAELCELLDPCEARAGTYRVAAAFHDIGIWTAHTFDYLEPSVAMATDVISNSDSKVSVGEISALIRWHHKTTSYTGEFGYAVNVFRKADWIDVSYGFLKFGITKEQLALLRRQYPYLGFHRFLARMAIKNFFNHPLRPLPMFRI